MEQDKSKPTGQPAQASTQEVLGTSVGASNADPRWENAYRALVQARDTISNRQQDLLSQAAEEVTPPQRNIAEQATDDYDRDWALSMAASEQETLYEIEQALHRIRTGTYGLCEATGKPIEPDRLTAIPWTRFSAEAEQRLETEGQAPHTRLGALQTLPKETRTSPVDEK